MKTQSTLRRAAAVLTVAATALLGAAAVTASPAQAAPTWAPAATAKIHPGVQMYTEGAQCTGNFVFTDAADNVYVGYAAHCAGLGEATDTNGCLNESVPLGTKVTFNEGGSLISDGTQVGSGTLVYSSWRTMRALGTTDANTCAYNDFALVKVDAADTGKVNPSIPFWGGPTGIDTDGTAAGDRVWSFGNSSLRAGITQLSPKTGISLGDDAADGGWIAPALHGDPGRPGRLRLGVRLGRRQGDRHPVDARAGPAAAVQQHRRPRQGARVRPGQLGHRRAHPGQRHRAVRPDPLICTTA